MALSIQFDHGDMLSSYEPSHPQCRVPCDLAVLHVARSIERRSYGVGEAAVGLARAQRELGIESQNWAIQETWRPDEAPSSGPPPPSNVKTFPRIGPERIAFSPAILRSARGLPGAAFAVLHQHGLWSASSLATRAWRRRFGRPTVVAPHGTLAHSALRRSRLKKWVARNLYEDENLRAAACLQALSHHEVAAIRDFGLKNPIALIENGIDDSWLRSSGAAARFRSRFEVPHTARLMLFLGRVTPIKGLPLLFEALAACDDVARDWCFVVAGPNEFGHMEELNALATRLHIRSRIKFIGPIYENDRRDAFEAAELLVLPSISEASPMVVFQSLGAGVPVLTTSGAPCEYLPREGCGWQAELSPAALQKALDHALSRAPHELSRMGAAGRDFAARRLTWSIAAQKSVQLYRWLLRQADRPDFVILD